MGKDKSDYIVPLDSYNLTLALTPIFVILIILMIVIWKIFGFEPIMGVGTSMYFSIFVYMFVKHVVLVELELKKLKKQWRSQMSYEYEEDRQDDIDEEPYYDRDEPLDLGMIISGHMLILGIVLKIIYGFSLSAYLLVALSSSIFVYYGVERLRHLLNKKHRSKRRS
jgi:energy-coupling factor transporter transmembrane protein EcfT